jgi:hypothetical protein
MALNLKIALYRGTKANLASLASTGQAGVVALTTDTNELFIDQGSGTAGYGNPGSGYAWIRHAGSNQVFAAASQAAMTALQALIGDLCVRSDNNTVYMLTAYPASTAANWTAVGVASGTTIQGLSGPTSHQFVTYIDSSGAQHLAQPAFTDISGSLAQTQLPASIGSGSNLTSIDCGSF